MSYTGPLDIYATGVIVAYSQRALSAAKRGTALYTIRRSSDNTSQSYSSDATTGAAPTATISAFIGAGSGFVSTWVDQSGNAVDAVQATLANQPGWTASANNSLPGLTFDEASAQELDSAGNAPVLTGGCSFLAVYKMPSPVALTTQHLIVIQNNPTTQYLEVDVTAVSFTDPTTPQADLTYQGDSDSVTSDTVVALGLLDAYLLLDGYAAHGTSEINLNGTLLAQAGTTDTTGSPGTVTGAVQIGANFTGTLQELIVYSGALSDAALLALRTNIASYYGITIPAVSSTARVPGYPPIAEVGTDEAEHRRQLARMFNRLNQGKFNCTV